MRNVTKSEFSSDKPCQHAGSLVGGGGRPFALTADTGGLFVVCGKGGGFVCGAGVRGVERAVDLFVARVSCGFSRLFIQLSVVFCDILFLNGWFQFISILLSISRLGNIPMA